jgi:hypothetical protein
MFPAPLSRPLQIMNRLGSSFSFPALIERWLLVSLKTTRKWDQSAAEHEFHGTIPGPDETRNVPPVLFQNLLQNLIYTTIFFKISLNKETVTPLS